jgi:hypothetical protein
MGLGFQWEAIHQKKPHFITEAELNKVGSPSELYDLFKSKGLKMRPFSGFAMLLSQYAGQPLLNDIEQPFTKFELVLDKKMVICQ